MKNKLATNRMVMLWGSQLSYKDHLEASKAKLQEIGIEYWRGTDSMFVYVPCDLDISVLVTNGMSEVFASIVLEARKEGIAFFFVKLQMNIKEMF